MTIAEEIAKAAANTEEIVKAPTVTVAETTNLTANSGSGLEDK